MFDEITHRAKGPTNKSLHESNIFEARLCFRGGELSFPLGTSDISKKATLKR